MKIKKIIWATFIFLSLSVCASITVQAATRKIVKKDFITEDITNFDFSYLTETERPSVETTPCSFGTEGSKDVDLDGDSDTSTYSIIGDDDRVKVKNFTAAPYRWVAYVETTWPNGRTTIGTAFMVGDSSAVTAAHMVYNVSFGGFAKSIAIYPGKNGNSNTFSGSHAKLMYVPKEYVDDQKLQFDCALIKLKTALGKRVGYFGLRRQSANYENLIVNLTGYPEDHPKEMWKSKGPITSKSLSLLDYALDTQPGMSGSPLNRIYNGNWYAIGVHTRHYSTYNRGVNFHPFLYSMITTYK